MLKVAGSIPGKGCTDLYCARGAQDVLPVRVVGAVSQLDIRTLTPLNLKVKFSMARSFPVENLLPQNVASIINNLQ